jgi:hypothetical protein
MLLTRIERVVVKGFHAPVLTDLHILMWKLVAIARRHITNVLGGSAVTMRLSGLLDIIGLGAVVGGVLASLLAVDRDLEQVTAVVEMADGANHFTFNVGRPAVVDAVFVYFVWLAREG